MSGSWQAANPKLPIQLKNKRGNKAYSNELLVVAVSAQMRCEAKWHWEVVVWVMVFWALVNTVSPHK